ncbi:MAG: hypothetical protein AB8B96_14090 [Lysobacterales bacterium]
MTEQSLPNWFDERIELWLDGELQGSEAALFEARLASDPLLEREVARATTLTSRLADLPSLKAPSAIQRSVMEMTGAGWSLPSLPAWGWSLGGACAAALVLLVTVGPGNPVLENSDFPETVAVVEQASGLPGELPSELPSEMVLAKARADLALALSYIDQAGDMAARQLGARAGEVTARSLMRPQRQRSDESSSAI